jgi:hypothetical protein
MDDITKRTAEIESTLNELEKRKEIVVSTPRPMPKFETKITRRVTSPAFPTAKTGTTEEQTNGGGGADYTFALEGSILNDYTADVLIHDGEVNGETPAGMGTDEYSLSVDYDGAFINLIVTYSPTTLEITSLTFEVNSEVPDPSLGTFYVEIGRVYLDFNEDTGKLAKVTTLNTQCGDINFALIYGAFNGAPALIPLNTYSTWVPLS